MRKLLQTASCLVIAALACVWSERPLLAPEGKPWTDGNVPPELQ